MPFSTTITPDGTGILRKGWGVITGAELAAAESELFNAPEIDLGKIRYALVDLSQVTEVRVSADEVRTVARVDEKLSTRNAALSVSIVAPHDVAFGLSRMWQMVSENTGWHSHVFRDRAGAVAWLRERVPELNLEIGSWGNGS